MTLLDGRIVVHRMMRYLKQGFCIIGKGGHKKGLFVEGILSWGIGYFYCVVGCNGSFGDMVGVWRLW